MAASLQKFNNVKLIEHSANDGDSFVVSISGTQTTVRLYFVDSPEKTGSSLTLRRLREQTRYFGLSNASVTVDYGKKAKEFTKKQLASPFTVHTAFAKAPGSIAGGRVYAFVTTSSGKSLDELLVRKGLARVKGVGRVTPNGTIRAERIEELKDLEVSAMLKHAGIWRQADPELLVESRADERMENYVLEKLRQEIETVKERININTTSIEELMQLKGIGKKRAEIIIKNRPYKEVEDLLRVKEIPAKIVIENLNNLKVK